MDNLVYEMKKVSLVKEKSSETFIKCETSPYGYFSSVFKATKFIRMHNKDRNCFFIMKSYVLDAMHVGQTVSETKTFIYSHKGELVSKSACDKFCISYHMLNSRNDCVFNGHDKSDLPGNIGDRVWVYNDKNEILYLSVLKKVPYKTNKELHSEDDKCSVKLLFDGNKEFKIPHEEKIIDVPSWFCFSRTFINSIF